MLIDVGGVGQSVAAIVKATGDNGKWIEKMVLADYNIERTEEVEAIIGDTRFVAERINTTDAESIKAVAQKHDIDFILNAVEPAFNENIFDTAFDLRVGYMDYAMTFSHRHQEKSYEK